MLELSANVVSSEFPFSSNTPCFTSLDLAILGCNVSENSTQAVRQLFRDIGPKLKLGYVPAVENYLPSEVRQYLITNHLKFCVLVVDAETVQDAYENLSPRKDEYEDLLKTAANLVGKVGFYSKK